VVFPLDAMPPTISPYLGVEDLEAIGLVGTATPCGATAAQYKYGLWYNVAPIGAIVLDVPNSGIIYALARR
jgi:hypothetical protein